MGANSPLLGFILPELRPNVRLAVIFLCWSWWKLVQRTTTGLSTYILGEREAAEIDPMLGESPGLLPHPLPPMPARPYTGDEVPEAPIPRVWKTT